MRRRTGLLAAVLALTVSLAADVGAIAPNQTGWWWVGRSGGLPTPPPSEVPAGGLYVAGDPTGAHAVSALRFEALPAAVTTLRLRIADVSGSPVLLACPAATPWSAAAGGDWAERPAVDCDERAAPGEMTADSSIVAFDVQTLVAGGVLDVVVVPARDPSLGAASATFSVSFEPPDAGTLEPAPAEGVVSPPADDEPQVGASNAEEGPGGRPEPERVAFTAPDAPPASSEEIGAAAPALTPAPSALATRQLSTGGGDGATRFLGALLLLSLGLIAVWVARGGANRLLVGVATADPGRGGAVDGDAADVREARGIGDFRRVRHGSPPSVR